MYKIILMNGEERKKWVCLCCGTDKSVKYKYISNGSVFPLCNKCVTSYVYGKLPK